MNTHSVAISQFVRRQTCYSQFSHWSHDDEQLLALVEANFGLAAAGYRDGVILVPVPPSGFFSNVVKLVENDIILGIYKPRQPGEEPRRLTFVLGGKKMPAKRVDVVLYRHDVLAENNERSSQAEWEIISVNAEIEDKGIPSPLKPATLMANHYMMSGGTDTQMSPEEFQTALHRASEFWRDKGDASPSPFISEDGCDNLELCIAIQNLNARVADLNEAARHYRNLVKEQPRNHFLDE